MLFQTNALGVMCVMVTIFVLLSHACMKQSVRVINGVFMANAKILNAGRKSKKFDNTYSHIIYNSSILTNHYEKYQNCFYFSTDEDCRGSQQCVGHG